MYDIRTDDGILVAQISNHEASRLINASHGFFRKWKTKTEEKIVWEFTNGCSFGNSEMKLHIWTGFILIPQ